MIFTPKFPLNFDDSYGFENIQGLKQLIFFHLKNLLYTFPGEKISDPDYGVGIEKYLFETLSEPDLNTIADEIKNAISRYLSYIDVVYVIAHKPQEDMLNIKIKYSMSDVDLNVVVSFDVVSGGSSASSLKY